MKKGKALTIVLIVLLLCIVVVGAIVGILYFRNVRTNYREEQEALLKEEINRIVSEGKGTFEIDDNIVTKGSYVEVEELAKKYYKDYYSLSDNLKTEYSNYKDFIEKCLQADNISKDQPEFTKTKNKIDKIIKVGEDTSSKIKEMQSDDYIEEQAETLSSEYNKNLFKECTSTFKSMTYNTNLNSFIHNYNMYLSYLKDVFEFLANHKNDWNLNNGVLVFNSQNILDQYNSAINAMKQFEAIFMSAYKRLGW